MFWEGHEYSHQQSLWNPQWLLALTVWRSPTPGAAINPNDRNLGPPPIFQRPGISKPPWFHQEIKKRVILGNKDFPVSHLICSVVWPWGERGVIPGYSKLQNRTNSYSPGMYTAFVYLHGPLWQAYISYRQSKPSKTHTNFLSQNDHRYAYVQLHILNIMLKMEIFPTILWRFSVSTTTSGTENCLPISEE